METLGLPFLEAMVTGLPILAPDLDFARYVCGDAALFYDPWGIESMFNTIMLIRGDGSLRKQLIEKGKAELKDKLKFAGSWEEVAADVLQHLKQLL
jgi:glycosyltransferase involved in cell wall biosynthesis